MARIEASITVNRPIEEVFTFTADVNNAAKWQSGIIEAVRTSSDPVGVGTTYRFKQQVVGQKMDTTGTLTAYDPPNRWAWKATSGPFPMSGATACEAVGDGTRVTVSIDAEPGGFFKLAEGLLTKQVQSQTENDLKKLKEIMEK